MDLATISPSKYEIRFYTPAQRGLLVNGLYALTGTPYHIHVTEDPDATGLHLNRLRITDRKTGIVTTCTWVEANYGWSLSTPTPDGGVEESTKAVTAWQYYLEVNNAIHPLGWTITKLTKDPAGRVITRIQRSLWGFPGGDGLVQESTGLEGAEEVTTTYYQQDRAAPDYGKPTGKTYPDGRWEYYAHDKSGRQTKLRTPAGDEPYPGSDAVSRVVITTNGMFWSTLDNPTETVGETVQGAEIARRYLVREDASPLIKVTEVECRTPGASIRAADNLVTITWKNPLHGEFADQPTRIARPDGTLETYAYALDPATREHATVSSRGKPDAAGTTVVDGARITARVHASGEVLSETVVDIASGRTLAGDS